MKISPKGIRLREERQIPDECHEKLLGIHKYSLKNIPAQKCSFSSMLSSRLIIPSSIFHLHPIKTKKSGNPRISLKTSKRDKRPTYYCFYIILQGNKNEQGFMISVHINIYCSGSSLARSALLKKWDLSPAGYE